MGGGAGGEGAPSQPFGMLMFTCNGRGSGLYGEDSYDARTLSTYVPVPVAGFQCNGERWRRGWAGGRVGRRAGWEGGLGWREGGMARRDGVAWCVGGVGC